MATTAFLLDQDPNYYLKLGEAIGRMMGPLLLLLLGGFIVEIS